MIDKKPFRVTNEESDSWINQKLVLTGVNLVAQYLRVKINDFAADLLDARELIDKQEAIIKEMRSFCKDVADNYDCDSDGHKYNTGCRSCNAKTILEKTKDYAE